MGKITDLLNTLWRAIRRFRVNRDFWIFVVFLVVAVVFWFLQTLKETTTKQVNYQFVLVGVPKDVHITSDVPDEVSVSISGRGFAILDFMSKNQKPTVEVNYNTLPKENGTIVIDANTWRRIFYRQLSHSLTYGSVSPTPLEIEYAAAPATSTSKKK